MLNFLDLGEDKALYYKGFYECGTLVPLLWHNLWKNDACSLNLYRLKIEI